MNDFIYPLICLTSKSENLTQAIIFPYGSSAISQASRVLYMYIHIFLALGFTKTQTNPTHSDNLQTVLEEYCVFANSVHNELIASINANKYSFSLIQSISKLVWMVLVMM